jgi:hypothetical protein
VRWEQPRPVVLADGSVIMSDWDGASFVGTCPEDEVITADNIHVVRHFDAGDVTIDSSYWWPPPPYYGLGGYTAWLVAWDETAIAGLTSSPIVLRGYFSQTYVTDLHNFYEGYVFEPRLEEDIDPATLMELEAADVAAVVVEKIEGYDAPPPSIMVVGLDGALRPL